MTTGPGAATTPPRWRRLVLAAVPWIAAAALGTAGLVLRDHPGAAAVSPAASAPSPVPSPSAASLSGGGATVPGPQLPPELELAVLATARTALGTAGLSLDGPVGDRWPVATAITGIESSGGDLLVVTVAALVIQQRDDHWAAPVVRAVAVPVRRTPPAVLGAAWPVPAPDLASDIPAVDPVDDVDPSLVAALEAAGWLVDEVTDVARVGSQHLRVTVHGVPPEEEGPGTHVLWLRDDPDGPTALPTTAHPHETDPHPTPEDTP